MLIGDAIAGSSSACNDGALGSRSVYWVASDYYAKAKRLNEELAEKAGKKMANMAKQFPRWTTSSPTASKPAVLHGSQQARPCSGETTTIRVR